MPHVRLREYVTSIGACIATRISQRSESHEHVLNGQPLASASFCLLAVPSNILSASQSRNTFAENERYSPVPFHS